jgi:hypothetical protein
MHSVSTQVQRYALQQSADSNGKVSGCCKYRPDSWHRLDGSWKRLFFERRLSELIELFIPRLNDVEYLERQAAIGGQFVRRLDIRQMMPPIYKEAKMPRVEDLQTSKKHDKSSTAAEGLNRP